MSAAAVVGAEPLERVAGGEHVEVGVPRVVVGGARVGLVGDGGEAALLALDPPPVVDELVAGDADQPGRRDVVDACPGVTASTAPMNTSDVTSSATVRLRQRAEQVAVDLADGVVVQGEQRGPWSPADGRHAHDPPIVAERRVSDARVSRVAAPTGSATAGGPPAAQCHAVDGRRLGRLGGPPDREPGDRRRRPTTVPAATRITLVEAVEQLVGGDRLARREAGDDGDRGDREQLPGAGDGVVDAGGDAGVVVVDGAERGGRQRRDGQRQAEPEHDDAGQHVGRRTRCPASMPRQQQHRRGDEQRADGHREPRADALGEARRRGPTAGASPA